MANYQIYFTKVGSGVWNGNPSADPVANVGGIDLSAMVSIPMIPTVQGTGDQGILVNFGASGFAGSVPSGYTAGWPAAGGGFTTLSPSRKYGSATLSGGNLAASFPTTAGMVQAADGLSSGQYYFEITNSGGDIFSSEGGGGIGQDYAAGGDFNHWISSCSFSPSSNLGGGAFKSGGTFHTQSNIQALGNNAVVSNVFTFPTSTTIGVAVFLTPGSAPQPVLPQAVPNTLTRWRGQVGLNWKGMALVGDAFTNVVGLSDFTSFTEYGNTMQFQITTPPIHEDRKRIFMPRFEIEVEAGDGISGDPDAVPQMWLEWSKDGGVTWSTLQLPQSMGLIGQYIKRLRWLNLGNSRTWVFRLTCTDNVRRYVIGTYTTDYKSLG